MKSKSEHTAGSGWLHRWVRRWSRFAWEEMLFDVGRTDDGQPKNWTEWNNVRVHLRESGKLRQPQELESPNSGYPNNGSGIQKG